MANLQLVNPAIGTRAWTIDSTGTISFGDAGGGDKIGSTIFSVNNSGATFSFTVQARIRGAAGLSLGWHAIGYQNLLTGTDLAGGDDIAGEGLFAVRCDHGMETSILVNSISGGTVTLLVTQGVG